MLKFRRSNTAAQPGDIPSSLSAAKDSGAQLDRKCSFVTSQLGHSKAAILIRNLSLPLAWPVEEYFGAKKEWREFTVQLGLGPSQKQPAGIQQQQFSRPLTNINRTYTDVEFPDEFVFAGQGPDFCIELIVYCKRTDESGAASMVQNISRSLGRSFGLSWRKYQQQQQELTAAGKGAPNRSFLEELRRAGIREEQRLAAGGGAGQTSTSAVPSSAFLPHSATVDEGFLQGWPQSHYAHGGVKMHPIAIAHFRLRNATLSGKTHSYTLERLPAADLGRQQLLPIYGNISAQILVQPSSLVTPLAQGSMDIFLSDAGILHQHLRCVLQGGRLRCWDPKATLDRRTAATSLLTDASMDPLSKLAALKTPLLCLNIGEKTILERTAFPTAFRLSLQQQHQQEDNDAQTAGVSHLLCICPTQRALIGWRNALQLQQLDCAVWSEFAVAQKNPHASALGILVGAEPPPFQPLASHNSLDMDNNGLAPVANKQTKSKIPKPAEVYDGIVSEKTSEVNPKSHRPRIGSSASLLVRSVSSHRQPQKPVRIKSFALSQEEEEEEKGSRMRPAGPSRTTLVETTLPTPTQSPLVARKMAQQQPQNSSPTALARRLTQQQQQSTKGVQRHISWSLGHHPEKPKKERPSAHQHFQQQENMKTFQQHQRHSAIDAKLPSKNTSEGIAEELPTENTGGGGGDGLRQRQPAMEEKQHPAMRKSNTDFPTTRTAAGAFVISLRIGEADEEGILQRNSGKQHNKSNGDAILLPTQGHNPSKYATIGGTTNSSTFLTPTSRPMDLSRSGSNHTLITSTPSTSIGPLISNVVSAADSHWIGVNESMPKSSNSNAVKFGSQRPNGRADRPSNPATKTAATTVNADTASFQQRPFNINLGSANFEKSPGQSQSQQQGRWARAHIGRTETWHFARTSEACTRL